MSLDKAQRRVRNIDEKCGVPMCIYWETEDIANWIVECGYPQYKECIERNFITGRHLICLDASKLPDMGITDFEHIKTLEKLLKEHHTAWILVRPRATRPFIRIQSVANASQIADSRIKDISAKVRQLIQLDHIISNMNVAMGNPMIAYLEYKRRNGKRTSNMTYLSFLASNKRWFR